VTLRGGNALTPGNIIGVPHRQELALFSADGEGRSPMGGLRLVVSAPLITRGHDPSGARAPDLPNPDLDEATLRGHRALVLVGDTAGATFRNEARTLLAQLQADVGTASGSTVSPEQVAEVSRALEQSEAAINSARTAEIKARVRSSVDLILLIRNISAISLIWLADLEEARETVAKIMDSRRPALDERLRLAFVNVDRRIALIGVQVAELQRGLRNLAESEPVRIKSARDEIAQEMRAAEIDIYDEWAWPLFDGVLELVRSDTGGEHAEELRRRFDIFAAERAEKYGR